MTELDPQLQALFARSRPQLSPPSGAEGRMLADFRARLDGPPGATESPQQPESSVDPSAGPSPTGGLAAKAQLVHGLKIAGAIVSLSTIGIGGLWAVGQGARGREAPPAVVATEASPASKEASSTSPEPEPSPLPPTVESSTGTEAEAELEGPKDSPRGFRPKQGEPAPKAGATLAAELRLIQAARAAPPAQALELLDRHAAEFPTGELKLERVALQAVALCELGRLDEAQSARASLTKADLSPLLRTKVEAACAPEKK